MARKKPASEPTPKALEEVVEVEQVKKQVEKTQKTEKKTQSAQARTMTETVSQKNGGNNMADKYLVCNTSKVKATNTGGRLHSAVLDVEVPNGALVFVEGLKDGETEIRTAKIPTTALIAGKVKPMLVMKPEINYSQSRKTDYALGIHRNRAGKAVPVIPLELHDEFELSQDFFTGRAASEIKVGDKFKMTDGATTYAYSASAVEGDCAYLEVTGVRDAFQAVTLLADDLSAFPVAHKMVMVEIKFN